MGNCIYSPPGKIENGEFESREKKSGMSTVKIVLTKEELDWLMTQLKRTRGDDGKRRGLQEFLGEIERERSRRIVDEDCDKFKPCLDSISECSEDLFDG